MNVYFDGGCTPNPGEMEVCAIVDGQVCHQRSLGYGSNNQAEWLALLMGLEMAAYRDARRVTAYGDSSLVINQANGSWKCKDPTMQMFLGEYRKMAARFEQITLVYVPREKNLAGIVIEERQSYSHMRRYRTAS